MPIWLQHLLVLVLVTGCVIYTGYQGIRVLWGKRSRLGSCCAKGCASTKSPAGSAEKIVFLPAELLRKSGKKNL